MLAFVLINWGVCCSFTRQRKWSCSYRRIASFEHPGVDPVAEASPAPGPLVKDLDILGLKEMEIFQPSPFTLNSATFHRTVGFCVSLIDLIFALKVDFLVEFGYGAPSAQNQKRIDCYRSKTQLVPPWINGSKDMDIGDIGADGPHSFWTAWGDKRSPARAFVPLRLAFKSVVATCRFSRTEKASLFLVSSWILLDSSEVLYPLNLRRATDSTILRKTMGSDFQSIGISPGAHTWLQLFCQSLGKCRGTLLLNRIAVKVAVAQNRQCLIFSPLNAANFRSWETNFLQSLLVRGFMAYLSISHRGFVSVVSRRLFIQFLLWPQPSYALSLGHFGAISWHDWSAVKCQAY